MNYKFYKKIKTSAFTLTELIIVIVIIAILASVLIPTYSGFVARAKKAHDIEIIKELNDNLNLDSLLDENSELTDYDTYDILLFNQSDHHYYLFNEKEQYIYDEYDDTINLSQSESYKNYFYFDASLDLEEFSLYHPSEPVSPSGPTEETLVYYFYTLDNSGLKIEYTSLEEAFNVNPEILYLEHDYTLKEEVTLKDLTLDLKGYNLTLEANLLVSGTVTITNSLTSNTSTIKVTPDYSLKNISGTLKIEYINLEGNLYNQAICYIKECTITCVSHDATSGISQGCYITSSKITEIKVINTKKPTIYSGVFYFDPTPYFPSSNQPSITKIEEDWYYVS